MAGFVCARKCNPLPGPGQHREIRTCAVQNPAASATMMKLADVALVADANQVCSGIIRALQQRIRD